MKTKDVIIIVAMYMAIVIIGLLIYQWYAELGGIYQKAAEYDTYKSYIDQMKSCQNIPFIMCSGDMNQTPKR